MFSDVLSLLPNIASGLMLMIHIGQFSVQQLFFLVIYLVLSSRF